LRSEERKKAPTNKAKCATPIDVMLAKQPNIEVIDSEIPCHTNYEH